MKKQLGALCLAIGLSLSVAVPAYADFYREPASIKGVLIDSEEMVPYAAEVGVSQVISNFPISWSFYEGQMRAYESFLTALDNAGITVTVIVLNDWQTSRPDLLPVQTPVANYYGFNVKTEQGVKASREAASNMAERFKGLVSNWVIGNEINDGQVWNYVGQMDIDSYCAEYAAAYRIWYDAIKEQNGLARVYIPYDFRWNCGQIEGFKFGAMDMLPRLNALLKDTDYGIAWHAYPDPFEDPVFTDDVYTLEKPDTYIVSLKNLHILTDYMEQADMRTADGRVRHLILSEQGFTSMSPTRGGECQELQAQCITEAYRTAAANPYVEAFMLNRLVDSPALLQANPNYAFGLMTTNYTKKLSWEAYKNVDKQ